MNKNDVLNIMEVIASDVFFKDYKIRKSDCSIICKTDYGYKRIAFIFYNSYDLSREDLALEITPAYDIRFNILHKWFEKYSKRCLTDQKDSYTVGFTGNMIGGTNEFYFLENKKDYSKDFHILYNEVIRNARKVFTRFSTLNEVYKYCINDVINGIREFPDSSFEWTIRYLIVTQLVSPSNYERVKELILQRIEYMMSRNEPNTLMYYNDLPTILKDLESTDFTSGKWGKLPISIENHENGY